MSLGSQAGSGGGLMNHIGAQLRAARNRLGLTLRQVEQRSNLLSKQWNNAAYRISASWLDRIERQNRGQSATKLIVLAYIYQLPTDQIAVLYLGANASPGQSEPILRPGSTSLPQRLLQQHIRPWLPDKLVTDPPPDDTMLLPSGQVALPEYFEGGIIGSRDKTMEPMILGGSIVLIDTRKRAIARRKDWTNQFDRPIYFLSSQTGHSCGFCELDKESEWLILVPHMLSSEPKDQRWRYQKEVEVIGTVTGLSTWRVA